MAVIVNICPGRKMSPESHYTNPCTSNTVHITLVKKIHQNKPDTLLNIFIRKNIDIFNLNGDNHEYLS